MLYVVCFALVALVASVTVTFAGLFRSQSRAAARREDLLVNQLMHLADRTWTPPPAWEPETARPVGGNGEIADDDLVPSYELFTVSPEQEP